MIVQYNYIQYHIISYNIISAMNKIVHTRSQYLISTILRIGCWAASPSVPCWGAQDGGDAAGPREGGEGCRDGRGQPVVQKFPLSLC